MGINLTLIGQIGTFLVFWWFVHRFVWPVFSNIAAERQRKIADGLSMADSARFKLQNAEQESEDIVSQAKAKASAIVSQANRQASELVDCAREEAKRIGEMEIAHAREQIDRERSQIRSELRASLSSLVIEGVEKIIEREVKADDHKRLLRELTEKI